MASNSNEVPKAAEFGQMVAYLARNGFPIPEITDIIGRNPAGRTRAEIADELRVWLKERLEV